MNSNEEKLISPIEYVTENERPLSNPIIYTDKLKEHDNANDKLYLILFVGDYYMGDDGREKQYKDFEFVTGRQAAYDLIKLYLEDKELNLDAMKSEIIVDSPNVPISKRISIYKFMSDLLKTEKIVDDTTFDIDEWYYEDPDNEKEE